MKKHTLLALFLLLILVACKPEESAPTEEPSTSQELGEEVTIRFAINDFEIGYYTQLAEAFEELLPNVHIKLLSVDEILGSDYPEDSPLMLAKSADVISSNSPIGDFEQTLRDLTPFIENDPNFDSEDFFPGVLDSSGGSIYVLPAELNFNLIFYNKELFNVGGVAYPLADWSWEDFRTTAEMLTIRTGGEVSQWGFVESDLSVPFFVETLLDKPLIDMTTDPFTPRFEDEDVAEAVGWYTDLYLDNEVAPYFPEPEDSSDRPGRPAMLSDSFALIQDGKVAMWTGPSNAFRFLNRDGNLGAVPYPIESLDDHTTPMFAGGLAMSAGTANPGAAWAWISFLSLQEQSGLRMIGPSAIPARISVAESTHFWDDVGPELAYALRAAVEHGVLMSNRSGVEFEALSDAVDAIISGELTLKDALVQAQADAESELAASDAAAETIEPFTVAEELPETEAGAAVKFVVAGDLGQYRELANQFHEAQPDITIDVRMPTFEGRNFDMTNMMTGADCFLGQAPTQQDEYQSMMLNLEPLIDADATFDINDFYPVLLDQFTIQGQLWGLPAEVNTTLIEFNKELFNLKGVDYPAPGWTMDDFLDAAVALTEGDGEFKTYGFVPESFELTTLLGMLERYGAPLFDTSEDVAGVDFLSPMFVEAMSWYIDLSKYGVKPIFITDPGELARSQTSFMERDGMIYEGRAGMWTASGVAPGMRRGRGAGLSNPSAMDIGVAPLPKGVAGGGSIASVNGYFIAADTEYRNECWQWINFLTESPDSVQGLPGRISVAESAEYRQKVGAELADAYIFSIDDVQTSAIYTVFARDDNWMWPAIYWLGRAHTEAINDDLTAEEALGNAQAFFDQYRACLTANEGFEDEDVQNECLNEVDPSLNFFVGG